MGYAFISYCTQNQTKADTIKDIFQKNNVPIWMAPYDIPPGAKYAETITQAIEECSCFVLLLTNAAQASEAVDSEVELATLMFKKPIIVAQLEDVVLNRSFLLYIHNKQTIQLRNLSDNDENVLKVIDAVRKLTGTVPAQPKKTTVSAAAPAPSKNNKNIYLFSEGNMNIRDVLGRNGANLSEMTKLGLPVPQGFILSTDAYNNYVQNGKKISKDLEADIFTYILKLESITGKKFGDRQNPLTLSVRSSSRTFVPGMANTVLNVGLNDSIVEALAEKTQNPRWAWDCYVRFIQNFSVTVMEISQQSFDRITDAAMARKGIKSNEQFSADDLKELASQFKTEYNIKLGSPFPQNPMEQLICAVDAVFRSWDNPRANVFRNNHNISLYWGTAATVQEMVFGNMNDNCAAGLVSTRNPTTGEKKLMGEFLINSQGFDCLEGHRAPLPITSMEEIFPGAYQSLAAICTRLEGHYCNMQEIEFTIENGHLYILCTRTGARTKAADEKIIADMFYEGIITKEQVEMMRKRQ